MNKLSLRYVQYSSFAPNNINIVVRGISATWALIVGDHSVLFAVSHLQGLCLLSEPLLLSVVSSRFTQTPLLILTTVSALGMCQESPPRSVRQTRFAHWDSRRSANPWLARERVVQMGKTRWR